MVPRLAGRNLRVVTSRKMKIPERAVRVITTEATLEEEIKAFYEELATLEIKVETEAVKVRQEFNKIPEKIQQENDAIDVIKVETISKILTRKLGKRKISNYLATKLRSGQDSKSLQGWLDL